MVITCSTFQRRTCALRSMARWNVDKLIAILDAHFPDWRVQHSDPHEAAEFYGLQVNAVQDSMIVELDFDHPDYRNLVDGFDEFDSD